MKIVCDNCSTKYSIADEKVRGKVFKIKCKKCSHIIVVKGQEATGEGAPAGFDQKETRVFDYSGFDGQKEGAAAAEPIWHLVIDREQVGPLTVAEVSQKWTSGEIDRDTYGWREGFADWQRLGAIEELASVLRHTAEARPAVGEPQHATGEEPPTTAEGPAGLFGDGSATPASGMPSISGHSDPTDLFAGAGTSTEDETNTADLFAGGRAAASSQPQVFASSAAAPARRSQGERRDDLYGDSDMAVAAGGSREAGPTMTAQRNENSVLFSLNNLSALAGGGEAPAPAPRSSAIPGSSFASGPEGSGLIDIRAMAAMTLGAKKDEAQPRARQSSASDDDLPVFSASSFSAPAAGVLLPTVQPQSNRLMYIFMGVVGLLAVAAIILVAVILLGKKSPPTATGPAIGEVASTPPSASPTTPPPTSATPSKPTAPPSSPTSPPPSSPTSPPPSSPTAAMTPPATPPSSPSRPSKPEKPRPTAATPTPNPSKPPTEPAAKPPESAPPRETPVKPQKCDEVACLVTPDLPCCPKKGQTRPTATPADSSLPDRLDQADIIAGMKTVNGRVMACNDKYPGAAAFKVKVTVSADGGVQSAGASAPLAGPAAGCVESAVKGARFKRTKNSITFNYPYTFR